MIYKLAAALALTASGADALVVGANRAPRAAPARFEAPQMNGAPLTKLVATIGPASEDLETLSKCVEKGLSVMRCNFSHATPDEFFLRVGNLRKAPGGERA